MGYTQLIGLKNSMEYTMKFSVLLSVYAGEKPLFFEQCLISIWDNQLMKPNEILIVKDGTLSLQLENILLEFSKRAPLKILAFNKNKGLGKALMRGVEECTYPIIARMDTDDIAKSTRFEKQIKFLSENPEIDLVGSWIEEFEGTPSNIVSIRRVPKAHNEIVSYLKSRCPFNHPTVMFKKDAVIRSGNYRSEYLKEDLGLWVRMNYSECKFANLQESLLYFRLSSDMYKRRGGLKYLKAEINIFNLRRKFGLINIFEYIVFLSITIPIRVVPSKIRKQIYGIFLR